MLERLSRGLSIAGASFSVLRRNPQRIVFPPISTTALGALVLTIGRGIAVAHKAGPADASPVKALPGFYMLATFIAVFFNAALVTCEHNAARIDQG